MDLGLAGARALVCGGSSGLGAGVAEALIAEGSRVVLCARPGERLESAGSRLGAEGTVGVDLADPDGPRAAVAGAVDRLGGLDLLLVNSGGPPLGGFEQLDEEAWRVAMEGTFLAAIRLIREALPHLRASDRPAIAVILSSSAREPIAGLTTSNATRPGLAGLIKSLAGELAPIRINGLAPGRVATDRIATMDAARAERAGIPVEQVREETIARIPLGRYGDPADVGRVAAFLLSPAAGYVTAAIVPVDGGMVRALP